MKMIKMKTRLVALLALPLLFSAFHTVRANENDAAARVINLTHAPCQLLESENGVDQKFTAWHESHCRRFNRKSEERMAEIEPMVIESGEWTFNVTNRDVDWPVSFWLRAEKMTDRLSLPKAELGVRLAAGESKSITLTLPPGDYVYSCPLNPTPLYRLTVVEPG